MDTIKDTAMILPFLFVTYLAMEWLESKTEDQSVALLSRIGRAGHLLGAGIGLIPQCGFSAGAASLFSGGVITLGTMLSVFLSTSDEMLAIFISSSVAPSSIAKILLCKFIIAFICGFAADAAIRAFGQRKRPDKHIHDLCEQDGCGCEEEGSSILKSALVHTAKIALFIFILSFALSILVETIGREAMGSLMAGAPVIGTLAAALIGLIPNCAASVAIAELYLEQMLTSGQMMAGLLTAAGAGLLVLVRTNRRRGENIRIIALLYAMGAAWGILIDALGITF